MCPLRILLGLLQLHLLVLFGANAAAAVNNNKGGSACPFSRVIGYRGGHAAFVPQPNSNSMTRIGTSPVKGRKQEQHIPIEPRVLRTTTIAVQPVSF